MNSSGKVPADRWDGLSAQGDGERVRVQVTVMRRRHVTKRDG
jgi:hypothetical protein